MNNTNPSDTNINSTTKLRNLLDEGLIAIKNKEYSSMEEVFERIEKNLKL